MNSRLDIIRKELNEKFSGLYFEEISHSYTVDNVNFDSVTQIVHSLAQPFDKEKVATAYAKKHGLIKEDVIAMWDTNSVRASSFGTDIHKYIEERWLGKEYAPSECLDEARAGTQLKYDRFHETLQGCYIPIVNEYRVYDKDYRIAGTIDAILLNTQTDELEIFDWKTSKEIKMENKWQKLKKFFWLDDANGIHYAFQLGIYKHIIEKNTSLKIDKMKIVQISELYPDIQVYEMPFYKSEIGKLMKERMK